MSNPRNGELDEEIYLYAQFGVFSQSNYDNPAEIERDIIREAERFADVDEDMIQRCLGEARCQSTDRCTNWAMNMYQSWARSMNETSTPLHELPAAQIDALLAKFFLSARKLDGTPYPRNSMYLIACGIVRKLRDEKRSDCNLICRTNDAFATSRAVLDARMKQLTSSKVGLQIKHAAHLTTEDERSLWIKGECGTQSSKSLLQTVFLYNCKLFGLRGGDEHRNLSVKDFTIKNVDGGSAIEFRGGKNKTFKGGLKDLRYQPKIIEHYVASDSDPNIADVYEKYFDAIKYEDPFYRRPLNSKPNESYRYANSPIGKNMLANMLKSMCANAGLQGNYSNHSGKHTAATQLFNAGIDEQLVMERTGHRSIEGVRKYKHKNNDQIIRVSNVLNPSAQGSTESSKNNDRNVPTSTLCHNSVSTSPPSTTQDEPTSTVYLNCVNTSPASTTEDEPTSSIYLDSEPTTSSDNTICDGNRCANTSNNYEIATSKNCCNTEAEDYANYVEQTTLSQQVTQRRFATSAPCSTTVPIAQNPDNISNADTSPAKKSKLEESFCALSNFFNTSQSKGSLFKDCTFHFYFGDTKD